MSDGGGSADPSEIEKFERLADGWSDPGGAFAPLHAMQPVRLDYVIAQIAAQHGRDPSAARPFAGLRIIDVGAGGGLAAAPMARLGAEVVGVDPSETAMVRAAALSAGQGLNVDYRVGDADAAAEEAEALGARYDAVLALEVVEHVADRVAFAKSLAALAAPGAVVILSTLNRTALSYLGAIFAAERLFGWLPAGTHEWRRFPTPDELAAACAAAGLEEVDRTGFVLDPMRRSWSASSQRLEINYAMTFVRAGA